MEVVSLMVEEPIFNGRTMRKIGLKWLHELNNLAKINIVEELL